MLNQPKQTQIFCYYYINFTILNDEIYLFIIFAWSRNNKKSCCLFFYMTYVYQLQIDKAKAYKGAKQAPTPPPRPP